MATVARATGELHDQPRRIGTDQLAALAGFVLLGPKPTGEDYRPDETDNLAWATQQVGLDLQAIRVRELELSVTTLEARNANLSEILAKPAVATA